MINKRILVIPVLCQTMLCSNVWAGVSFILTEDSTENSTAPHDRENNYAEACRNKGFSIDVSSCTGNSRPGLLCPFSSNYTDECCSAKYAYTIMSSCRDGTVPSESTCGGRYACVCPPEYGYGIDRNKCIGSFGYDYTEVCYERYYTSDGSYMETPYFKGCTCPNNYAICKSEYNLKGAGDSCTYKGSVYYTNCVCQAGYNKRCSTYNDPKEPGDYCKLNGVKYYKSCINESENAANDKDDETSMNSTDQ